MRSLIAAALLLLAGPVWAEDTPATPDTTEQAAQATYGATGSGLTTAPNVPPEIAAWTGSTFYPNEFCYKVYTMDRSIPQYWDIRRYCDKQEHRGGRNWF